MFDFIQMIAEPECKSRRGLRGGQAPFPWGMYINESRQTSRARESVALGLSSNVDELKLGTRFMIRTYSTSQSTCSKAMIENRDDPAVSRNLFRV